MNYLSKVDKLNKEIKILKEERNDLLHSLQDECKHPIDFVREIEYEKGFTTIRPFRLCLRCGYAEEGWHCGYYKLHRNVYGPISDGPIKGMDRKKARKLTRTFKTQSQLAGNKF